MSKQLARRQRFPYHGNPTLEPKRIRDVPSLVFDSNKPVVLLPSQFFSGTA